MSTTTTPSMTFNSAGNVIASGTITASSTANADFDLSSKLWGLIHVLNTPGGSVSATRGLQIDIFDRYASGPTTSPSAIMTRTLPSATASTTEGTQIRIPTGKYNIKLTNLDAAQSITASVTMDTIDSMVTA